MGIDRRRNYGIMLDTETANTIQDGDKLDMSNVLPYDFGWAVIDSKGNVYETYSFVNRDIFCYERDLMQSAYCERTRKNSYSVQRNHKMPCGFRKGQPSRVNRS